MSRRERREAKLHALHDGQLSPRAARRVAARAEGSAEDRAELARLRAVGDWVREAESDRAGAAPDLWSGLAPRLAAIDAERERVEAPGGFGARWWAPLAAGAAVAAVVGLVVFGVQPEAQAATDVVQWLDSEGSPVMVMDAPDEGTIIWVLEPGEDEISGSAVRVSV